MSGYRRNRLPFPYSYTTRGVFANDVTVGEVPPHKPNDCNLVIAQLTDDTLFKLTSAMQAGLDLIYPDEWQTLMDWWTYAVSLSNTGTFVNCGGDEILDICDIVADCIRNSTNVQNAINEVINIDNPDLPPAITPLPALDDLMDCVWGASEDTYELVLDAWETIKTIIDQGLALVDTVTDLGGVFPVITPPQMASIDLLLQLGTTALDAYLNQQSTQDKWACKLFTCIVQSGRPYNITRTCIDEAMSIFAPPAPFDIIDLGDFLIAASSYNTFRSYWQRRSDDSCNNDWETVCGLSCGDPEPTIEFWGDARIFEITANGVPISVSPTQQAFALSGGWSPLVVKFNGPVCLQSIRSRCSRAVTANRPNSFDVEFGSYTDTIGIGGTGGAQDFVINPNNAIGDTLTLTASTAPDDVSWAWQLVNITNPGIFTNELT